MTYTEVTRIRVDGGRATGVEWRNASGERGTAAAQVIVNAAGPWVDAVLGDIAHTRLLGGTKGSHLVVPGWPNAPRHGVYVEAASDGRPFFILPWNGLYLIGTTDERVSGDPGTVEIAPHEVAYLVKETERVFPAAAGLAQRVCYTHTGVRPLPFTRGGAAGAITRRHVVRRHRSARGAYSIVGGKLTTHRALAEDVLRYVAEVLPLRERTSPTRSRPLPGALAAAERAELLRELGTALGAAHAARLWSVYGGAARKVAAIARERGLLDEVAPGTGMLAAEAVYALECEWAQTLVDVLQRRTMAGLAADFGLRAAAACAERLSELGVWDRAGAAAELEAYRDYARRHGALGRHHDGLG
jgi:glycerol-3-phosphate dehydrogenase